jgi:hypothetical protein
MGKSLVLVAAIIAAAAAPAEIYRLRAPAMVDVVDDAGKKIGSKRLAAKTLITLPGATDASDSQDVAAPKKTKFPAGAITGAEFDATHPATAIFCGQIRLDSQYLDKATHPESKFLSVMISTQNQSGSPAGAVLAYVARASATGKKILQKTKDGDWHDCTVNVTSIPGSSQVEITGAQLGGL